MPTTLRRIAILSAGLITAGLLTGCGCPLDTPSETRLPSPTPGVMPSPATTAASIRSATQNRSDGVLAIPMPSGLQGRYVLKITDASTKSGNTMIAVP